MPYADNYSEPAAPDRMTTATQEAWEDYTSTIEAIQYRARSPRIRSAVLETLLKATLEGMNADATTMMIVRDQIDELFDKDLFDTLAQDIAYTAEKEVA